MTEFDALIENARSHCQTLDANLQQQSLALDEVEQALQKLETEIHDQALALQGGVNQAGQANQARHQADEEGCQRALAFVDEFRSRLQTLEDRLRGDLEALPSALAALRHQAQAAAPALTESASLLHTRLTELDSEVDAALVALDAEMSGLEKQVRTLQDGALQQKAALEKQLADCLEVGEAVHQKGSQTGQKLSQRMLEADTQVGAAAQAAEDRLRQASQSASTGLREKHLALAAQLTADTQQIHDSVLEVERSYSQAVSRTREGSFALHTDLTDLCQNLEPLLRLHDQARKTGAL